MTPSPDNTQNAQEPIWVTLDRFSWCPEAQRKKMLEEIRRLAND